MPSLEVPFLLQVTEHGLGCGFQEYCPTCCHSSRFEALMLCLQTALAVQRQKVTSHSAHFTVKQDSLFRLNTTVASSKDRERPGQSII
jgi:hypothetical protein